ncbi:MAG TPA: Ig-like domain-containing protein [Gemmatimonadales bacterium]
MQHRAAGGLLAALLLSGCSAEEGLRPRFVVLEVVSGSGQSGHVGANLPTPLVVRVVDQLGEPVAGVPVTWSVSSGGGTVSAVDPNSNAEGLASANFRLGNFLGPQSAQAFLGTGFPVTFTATGVPAPAAILTPTAGTGQSGAVGTTLPQEIVIRVNDAFGNVVPGTEVSFTVTAGGGTVSVPSAISDAGGLVRFRWTLGPVAGTQTVSAAIFGVVPLSINATATAAAAANLMVLSGAGQTAPPGMQLPEPLVVQVTDRFDNPIRDVLVTWTPVGATAGMVNPTTSRSDANGEAVTAWTLGATGGSKTVRAAVVGVSASAAFDGAGEIIFKSIAAGRFHSCGFDDAGGAYCWGLFGEGQLGMGPAPAGFPSFLPSPQSVLQGANLFATEAGAASLGAAHSCAIVVSLDAYCWGRNSDGRLGNGGTSNANAPVQVSGSGFRTISAGGFHTCALTTGDRVFCWGLNSEGQVGATGGTLSPVAVLPGQTFGSVDAGGVHSCAIASGGAAYCWGSNTRGQLGATGAGGSTPVEAEGGILFATVAAGHSHTCALTADGTAYCWGDNDSGQLGVDPVATPMRAFPAPAAPGFSFVTLTAGLDHTCGLTAAGLAYCWGRNSSGELGDGSTVSSSAPVAVGEGLSFEAISAGDRHTCGVTTSRVAYCWGSNQFGQIGDGSPGPFFSLPVKVAYQP